MALLMALAEIDAWRWLVGRHPEQLAGGAKDQPKAEHLLLAPWQ